MPRGQRPASTNAWRRAVRSPTCLDHDRLDDVVADRAGRARPRRVNQPIKTIRRETEPPFRHRRRMHTKRTRRRSCSSTRRRTPTRSDNATPTPETTNAAAPSAPTSSAHQRSTRCPPSADHDAPYPAPPILVVLTDGTDVSSHASLADAIAAARQAGALVYPIGIVSSQFDPTPLQELASRTGGRYTSTTSTKALRGIYTSIAAELGRTWHASYLTNLPQGQTLHLQAQLVGAGSATAATHLSGRASSATAASPLIPSFLYGIVGSILLGLILTGLLALGIWSMRQAKEGTWVQARLAPHVGEKKQHRLGTRERLSAAAAIFTATEHALGNMNLWKRLSRTIERADIPLRTVEFVYVMAGAGFGLGIVLAISGQTPAIILLGMLVGAFVPYAVLTMKVKKRLASFETQLPDLLVTMAASLKAGHSFKQGMQAVVDENRQPASDEFRRVLTETSLGRPMDSALKEMADRIGSSNFEFVITAVTIQRQVGGSMAELFDMVADTVRQRQQFARKIKALTSMGRMSAYVLVGLPFFMAFFITVINPTYMQPLYSTGIGHFLIFLSLAGMVVGSLLLKKIVSFRG